LEALTTKGLGGKEPNMLIIGCDYHPGLQQIAFVDTETGELSERRLAHREEAEQLDRELKQQNLGSSLSACSCALKECSTVPTLLEIAILRQLSMSFRKCAFI
jgi:hypothetical protein